MTCAHCEELREEIRFLKRERDIEREKAFVDRLKVHCRITPGDALVLAALYRANGRCLSIAHLDEVVPHLWAGDDRSMKHVDIRVSRIRKALGKATIENVRGNGYFLTALDRDCVKTRSLIRPATTDERLPRPPPKSALR